jgi:hypothetical protein
MPVQFLLDGAVSEHDPETWKLVSEEIMLKQNARL